MSSSVPPMEFEISHFLNEWANISSARPRHASKTQEGAFTFPARVKLFSPSTIHVIHLSRIQSLSGLFRQTFSGCRTLVNLLGITAMSVLVWGSACFRGSVSGDKTRCNCKPGPPPQKKKTEKACSSLSQSNDPEHDYKKLYMKLLQCHEPVAKAFQQLQMQNEDLVAELEEKHQKSDALNCDSRKIADLLKTKGNSY
ncbi:uncharacterized protein LOC141864459 isoform X2 [Acropora palmata]